MKRPRLDSSGEQILLDHVRELQKRFIVCVVVLLLGGVLGYVFFEQIVETLRAPLGANLYYNSPAGSFSFVVKVCTMVGVALSLPVVVYNLMMFLRPAFERALSLVQAYFLAVASVLLAICGVAFAYYMIIPGALHFFSGFAVDGLSALITADSYLSFVTNVIITFVIVFQIPLIMILIDRIKPMTPKKLFASEKYVILAGLIVSLFMPYVLDITTSLLIVTPIVVLYNLSIAMIIWQHARVKRRKDIESRRLAAELDIDDAVLDEMLSGAFVTEMAASNTRQSINASYPKSVSRAGMEISRSSRETIESMQQAVKAKRAEITAQREARLKALPRIFTLISDVR